MKMVICKIVAIGLCVGLCISIVSVCQDFNESTSFEVHNVNLKKSNNRINYNRSFQTTSYDTSFDTSLNTQSRKMLVKKQDSHYSQQKRGEKSRLLHSRTSSYSNVTSKVGDSNLSRVARNSNLTKQSTVFAHNNIEFKSSSDNSSVSKNPMFGSNLMFLPGDDLLPPGTTPGSEPTIPLRGELVLVLFGFLYVIKRKYTY